MQKRTAVRDENFQELIRKHCCCVLQITWPRRFGKPLFLDTLKNFLQMDFENPGAADKHAKFFSGQLTRSIPSSTLASVPKP